MSIEYDPSSCLHSRGVQCRVLLESEIKDIEHLLKKLESQIDLVRTDRMRLSNRGGMYVAILLYGPPDPPLGLLEAGAQCTPYKPPLTMTIRKIL